MINGISTVPLLDQFPGAGAAWSLRKLRTNYNGPCIRVRRSSDNTEKNIGFINNQLDITDLINFTGTGHAFISVFYNQSVREAYDLIQPATERQPKIVDSGLIITENNKPALSFDGIDDYMEVLASQDKFIELHSSKSLVNIIAKIGYTENLSFSHHLVDSGGTYDLNIGYSLYYSTSETLFKTLVNTIRNGANSIVFNQKSNTFLTNRQSVIQVDVDVSNTILKERSTIIINNNTVIKENQTSGSLSTAIASKTFKIGVAQRIGNTLINYHHGTMQEIVIYLNDQSANRPFIGSNINSYYNVY